MADIKLVAFDLDGTLTQHKTPLGEKNKAVLDRLRAKYELVMVGAGTCARIFNQLQCYPINVIGSYGMQYAEYDHETGGQVIRWNEHADVDRDEIMRRAMLLREKYDLHEYVGEPMEFHPTGALTFPVLGTKAVLSDKLAYDPDKTKRRAMYPFVRELFHDYNVMIGGTSSFDMVPGQYGKLNALRRYMALRGLTDEQVVYCGDDYREGGNDHDVYAGGIPFVKVDDYEKLGEILEAAGVL
ncbi:MAG: HAD-IIB family hydrolase [Clostridia bacterium]|nr:HAD-IIB family hydrolase [Clostridia bacterium]